MKKYIVIFLLLNVFYAAAQDSPFRSFMRTVAEKNLDYLVQRYDIDIAEASLQAARVFNDPELSVGYSDNQDKRLQMGRSVEFGVGYNFSLGGVRKARIGVAQGERDLSQAAFEEYFRTISYEASAAWADAWKASELEQSTRLAYEDMLEVALADSIRSICGEIEGTDAMQTKVEAESSFNEWLAAENLKHNAILALSLYAGGGFTIEDIDLPELTCASEPISELLAKAEMNRADLKVAEMTKALSLKNLALVKAARAMEVNVNAGYSVNGEVRNEIAPAPAFKGVTIGGVIPLKFSSLNKGDIKAVKAEIARNELAVEAARLRIKVEVEQACNELETARMILEKCSESMSEEAREVIRTRKDEYLSGQSGLTRLLSARSTFWSVRNETIAAACNYFLACMEMNRVLGFEYFK